MRACQEQKTTQRRKGLPVRKVVMTIVVMSIADRGERQNKNMIKEKMNGA